MADKKEVYVGAVIEINQKRINLIPSTPVNQIDERGLKLSLDKPLELGKLQPAMDSICKDIGIKENPLSKQSLDKIESPLLKNVANKVANANMRIEALKYEQPPVKYKDKDKKEKADQQDPTKYVFVASVNWTDDEASNETNDFFKLKGLIFGISSGYTDSKSDDNPEVQKAFLSALQALTPVAALPPATNNPTESQNAEAEPTKSLEETPPKK